MARAAERVARSAPRIIKALATASPEDNPAQMRAALTFVKADDGDRQRVHGERADGHSFRLRLHVTHDLRHLVVESMLGIDDGLWSSLVDGGAYAGATVEHFAAKALTNAIAGSVEELRMRLESFRRIDLVSRPGYDHAAAERMTEVLDERIASLADATLLATVRTLSAVLERWNVTPVGDVMRLDWPLAPDREEQSWVEK